MARVAFLLFKKLCYRQYSKSFRPISLLYKWSELISGYFCGRRGMCAWRGVEDRERAWGWLIKVRRASDLPSKIFTPGKFYVPDRHTPEGGRKSISLSASEIKKGAVELMTAPSRTMTKLVLISSSC